MVKSFVTSGNTLLPDPSAGFLLHPKPETRNPKPETRNPLHYPLYHTPYTLHPAPYTYPLH